MGSAGYLIRCCRTLGLRVPEEIAVIGSDETDLSLASKPTVTTVMPAAEPMGFEAMRWLQDLIAGKWPNSRIVRVGEVQLRVRESTGLRKPEACDVAGARHYIQENACRGLTVRQLIKKTQRVSKVTFHRRFQEVVGKSPAEAIRDRKLDEVRRLLVSTDLPLTMISNLSGFSSSKVMARVFRRVEKVALSVYRKRRKSTPPNGTKTAHQPPSKP
jgi:LacI family transcriptional regulator